MQSFELDMKKKMEESFVFRTTDGAYNMTNSLNYIENFVCFAHILHNTISNGLQEENVKNLVCKIRNIIKFIKNQDVQKKKLIEIAKKLNINYITLKLDIVTRWNSVLEMLSSFENNKLSLINYWAISSDSSTITSEEWSNINGLIKVLKHFKKMTEKVSKKDSVN